MKKLDKILIVLFVIILVFLYKGIIVRTYNQTIGYLGNKIFLYSNKSKIRILKIKKPSLIKEVFTPGALKVKNSSTLSNETKLSSKKIIIITNKFRKENGALAPLKENSKLDLSAEKKLKDMFTNQYFEHISPTGIGVADLANQVSYSYIIIGENLALGDFKNSQSLVDAWMASPGHRANILNKNYTEIGVAVGQGMFKGEKVWLAIQHFGLPKNICPTIDKILSVSIVSIKDQIKKTKDDLSVRLKNINNGEVYDNLTIEEQIDKYNSLVLIYNKLIIKLKEDIIQHNKEIKAFNSCVISYTS